jgi:hypothetical protein
MTNRMHHSFPDIDQYSWPGVQGIPFISSPTPSNCSSGPPQMQLDLFDPSSMSSYQNSFKALEDFYAPPCANVSAPPGRQDVLNALSQLYSANPRPPGRSARQTPPEQQFVFGDAQSGFAFDIDSLFLSPTAYKNPNPAPNAPISVLDPPQAAPPGFLPHPPPPTNQTSFPQNSQLDGRNYLTCPIPFEPVSKLDDPSRQEGTRVTAPPPKRHTTQRASGSSKKRKTGKADNDDEIVRAFLIFLIPTPLLNFLFSDAKVLLQCCKTVKPESLARHLKSDGHKRNAGLPLDRPEVCSLCNIA